MNYKLVALGVLAIFLIFILYTIFVPQTKTLASSASLSNSNTSVKLDKGAQSMQYTYSIWLYVNNWDTQYDHFIFSRQYAANEFFGVLLDGSMNVTLLVPTNSSHNGFTMNRISLSNWCNITVCVNANLIDYYFNGKLYKSMMIPNQITSFSANNPVSMGNDRSFVDNTFNVGANANPVFLKIMNNSATTTTITTSTATPTKIIGLSTWDAHINKFQYTPSFMGPHDVYANYLSGNGSDISNMFNYGVDISLFTPMKI